jgi:LmbE family N-acetylglucosaminyl deacetylase
MTNRPYTHIYLSPHLDDAVLSCGGAIYTQARAGARVLVVTFFAASPVHDEITPFTRELKARWGGDTDPVAVRRGEDLAALGVLGAEGLHLPFADCVYRTDPCLGTALYPDRDAIFADVHPAEARFPRALLAALDERVSTLDQADVYAPLTVGHHVDHLLVQRVALLLLRRGLRVRFYEDYPYAGDAAAVRSVLDGWREECGQAEAVKLDEDALRAKGDAVACHASQISTFWGSLDEMRQALRAQALAVGGAHYAEHYWRVAPDCLPEEPA